MKKTSCWILFVLVLSMALFPCHAYTDEAPGQQIQPFVSFSELDALGRVGPASALLGPEYPAGAHSSIKQMRPTGWNSVRYDIVPGGWLYNRCHLIARRFVDGDVQENIFTGTHALNSGPMAKIENQIAAYIGRTGHHVRLWVTPVFLDDELVCRALVVIAESVEDEEIRITDLLPNEQPGIIINYQTGESAEEVRP
jgi:DNA-entry nuclease